MEISGVKGHDISVFAPKYAIFRVQGMQWRVDAQGGVATLKGRWTQGLDYYGGRTIEGNVWIGKTKYPLRIAPRG